MDRAAAGCYTKEEMSSFKECFGRDNFQSVASENRSLNTNDIQGAQAKRHNMIVKRSFTNFQMAGPVAGVRSGSLGRPKNESNVFAHMATEENGYGDRLRRADIGKPPVVSGNLAEQQQYPYHGLEST